MMRASGRGVYGDAGCLPVSSCQPTKPAISQKGLTGCPSAQGDSSPSVTVFLTREQVNNPAGYVTFKSISARD
ncbi:MAG: hypothetical protein H6R25_2222 [Proteobacteria bacterium]|nr:hypothetical protein [Pseudomonadota bacterium]